MSEKLGAKTFLNFDSIKNIIINPSTSVKQALEAMDDGGMQIVLVIDGENRLVGLITDGDLRRAVLNDLKLDANIDQLVQTNFATISADEYKNNPSAANRFGFNHIPVISGDHYLVGLLVEKHMRPVEAPVVERNDTPVVIMAGGLGSRLAPFTKILPKPLLPIGDRTILEQIIETFTKQGFWNFFVIVNYKRELMKAYFAEMDLPYQLTFIDELQALGTAGGLSYLRDQINGTFILSNADVLLEIDYVNALAFHKVKDAVASIVTVTSFTSVPYGVVEFDESDIVREVREKPNIKHHIVSGMYILSNKIFDYIAPDTPLNMDKLLNMVMKTEGLVTAYKSNGLLHDMGEFQEYQKFLQHFSSIDDY